MVVKSDSLVLFFLRIVLYFKYKINKKEAILGVGIEVKFGENIEVIRKVILRFSIID